MKSRHLTRLAHACVSAVIACALLLPGGESWSQTPAWAVGTWKGTLERYPSSKNGPDRVLIVDPSGNCSWDYPVNVAKATRARSCSITADTLSLYTGADSVVKLRLTNGKLQGTFTSVNNAAYNITMTK